MGPFQNGGEVEFLVGPFPGYGLLIDPLELLMAVLTGIKSSLHRHGER